MTKSFEERFCEWKLKYPTKTIGDHHYIRERNIKKFILSEIELARKEERERIVKELLKIEKDKWRDASHCSCLGYAIVTIFGDKYEEEIKKINQEDK